MRRMHRGLPPVLGMMLPLLVTFGLSNVLSQGMLLMFSADDGLTLVSADGTTRLPAEAPEIYDVSGSRDALDPKSLTRLR